MTSMFYGANAFVKDVKVWNVCKVLAGKFEGMFEGSGQGETNLVPDANGECIACPAETTSGSGKYVQGQNPCCLNDISFRKALALWFSDSNSAASTYGNIKDW